MGSHKMVWWRLTCTCGYSSVALSASSSLTGGRFYGLLMLWISEIRQPPKSKAYGDPDSVIGQNFANKDEF